MLLGRIASHLKADCYKIITLNIGGPHGDHRATCVAVISSTLSHQELRRRGFEWHGLSSSEDTPTDAAASLSQDELDNIEKQVNSENSSTELIRIDFMNCHWKSSYNIIRGALHHSSIERALILLDGYVKAGCFKLEALSAVRDWCTVTIDSELTKEELRAKGFRWHGLEGEDVADDEDGAIVMPGWSRAGDGFEDDKGNWVSEQREWRDL